MIETQPTEVIDEMLSEIVVLGVDVDVEGEEPQICLTIQAVAYVETYIPNDDVHVFLTNDGTYTTHSFGEPLENIADLFDLWVTKDGEDRTTTQAEFDALVARVQTVIDQGVAAIKAAGIPLDFSADEDGELSFFAAQQLKAIQDDPLAVANAE